MRDVRQPVYTAYALRINLQNLLSGHLWQGRFFSCVLEKERRGQVFTFSISSGLLTLHSQPQYLSAVAQAPLQLVLLILLLGQILVLIFR